jgi:hypothetical protein
VRYLIMAKTFMCKKCKVSYPEDGFVYKDGGFGSEWDVVPPCRKCRRNKIYRDRYGISLVEVEAKLDQQHFHCGICNMKLPSIESGNVDMDRGAGVLRGILCDDCSWVLRRSRFNVDLLQQAVFYLDNHAITVTTQQNSAAATRLNQVVDN